MKAVPLRQAALSRHTAPAFVLVAGLELMQLRKLGDLPFRLFIELLAMADHVTGRVQTSYAVLLSLLDFDQAACAHADDKPTPRRVRTALEHLISLGLVKVDRIRNEKAKGLFLKVNGRAGISASKGMSDRLSDRPRKAAKPATARVSANRGGDERQTERQGVQEKDLSPTPLLSTAAAKPSRTVLEMKARVRRAAGGIK